MDGIIIKGLVIVLSLTVATALMAEYSKPSDDHLSIADAVEDYLETGDK